MMFLTEILAFGTMWFWLLSLALFVTITALVENEEGVWATIVFVGTILMFNFLSKIPILEFVKTNPWRTLAYVGIYFVGDIVWTFIKWGFHLHKSKVAYEELKHEFLKQNNAESLTPELAAKLIDKLKNNGITAEAPDPADHKADLIRWGAYWPFSFVGTLLNDVVRRSWEYIYQTFQSTYRRMSKAMFKSVEADLKLAEEYRAQQAEKAAASRGDENPSFSRRRG